MLLNDDFLSHIYEDEILEATPSFHVLAYEFGDKKIDLQLGDRFKLYDIASLTKIVFTTSILMEFVDEGKLDVNDDVSDYWEEFPEGISVKDLLVHGAGHRWWAPLYENLGMDNANEKVDFYLNKWDQLESLLLKEQRGQNEKNIYSDIDFMILGAIAKRIAGKDLYSLFTDMANRWGLKNCFFNKNNQCDFAKSDFAPTEFSEQLGRLLQAEVHDENTYSLGGVSSHAGLFSDMKSIEQWMMLIRNSYYYDAGPISQKVVEKFSERQISGEKGDWALGFMMPTPGSASSGQYFSSNSFGHTGFTGTSIWMDPDNDIFVCVLSNRVCPTRENKKFVPLRAKIHDAVYLALKGSKK